VENVDLELSAGSASRIEGANGAGKTTLLRVATGLIRADSGSVEVDGFDAEKDRREFQRRVGFVSTGYGGLYARLTVRAQLEYFARLALLPRNRRPGLIAAAIARFALDDIANHRVDRISMGQRQRTRLAVGFLHEPTVVLLDEPRNSLDGDGTALLTAAVGEFRAAGRTVLWCSPAGEDPGMDFDADWLLSDGRLRST
jgi:ABC-2 type transport system ATP-binding protein